MAALQSMGPENTGQPFCEAEKIVILQTNGSRSKDLIDVQRKSPIGMTVLRIAIAIAKSHRYADSFSGVIV